MALLPPGEGTSTRQRRGMASPEVQAEKKAAMDAQRQAFYIAKAGHADDAKNKYEQGLAYQQRLGGGAGYGGGGYGATMAAAPQVDPMSDPAYLASLANIDATEAQAIGDVRYRQDATRRALSDLLGEISDREVKGGDRTKDTQETKGLLRSGATERMLADVAEASNAERARGETSTSDTIGDLERAIAQAKIAAEKSRADARLSYSSSQGLV